MGSILKQEPNTMPRITEIWAFCSVDPEDGNEGVMAFYSQTFHSWVPLIAADTTRLDEMRKIVEDMIRDGAPTPVRLVKFTTREDVEVLGEGT